VTERIFAFDHSNYRECQRSFRGDRNQEYYLGDYRIEANPTVDVRADRRTVGTYSIIRLRSRSRLSFRRALSHIREDGTDVTVLWLVKRGRLRVTHQAGCTVVGAGDFAITKSTTPFFMECLTDQDAVHEVLHVVLPSHELQRFLPRDLHTGFCMPASGREFAIAERLLTDVFEDTGELPEHIAQLLVDSALSVLGDAIGSQHVAGMARQTVGNRRMHDIVRFIDLHLSDPKLSVAAVARGCGISPRYLCVLLKEHGTSYSRLVWEKRLNTASQWLRAPKPEKMLVAEVAFRAGFKSAAHFSRMFKRIYNMSPLEYRASAVAPTPSRSCARAPAVAVVQ
jgi:AraC-like DNA-binding protein